MNSRVLKHSIVYLGLDFGDCRCQGYDGAQGHVKGMAKRFKDNNSAATSVHSLTTLH